MNTVPPLDITDLPDAIIAMSSHVCLLAAKSSRKNTSNWSLYKNSTGMELPIKPGEGGGGDSQLVGAGDACRKISMEPLEVQFWAWLRWI